MKRCILYLASTVVSIGLILQPSEAFPLPLSRRTMSPVTLHLVPGQGNQLVAAYNAATCKNDDDEDDAVATKTMNETPRNFVNKVFNLPSVRRHPHPKAEGVDPESDVVYYPMIGFTFCRNGDRVIALPTKSHVSCRLPNRNEEVYGWFSPVCKLDLYSDDPCREPTKKESE